MGWLGFRDGAGAPPLEMLRGAGGTLAETARSLPVVPDGSRCSARNVVKRMPSRCYGHRSRSDAKECFLGSFTRPRHRTAHRCFPTEADDALAAAVPEGSRTVSADPGSGRPAGAVTAIVNSTRHRLVPQGGEHAVTVTPVRGDLQVSVRGRSVELELRDGAAVPGGVNGESGDWRATRRGENALGRISSSVPLQPPSGSLRRPSAAPAQVPPVSVGLAPSSAGLPG